MPNLLVTGFRGQVGQELFALRPDYPDLHLIGMDLPEWDLTDEKRVRQFFREQELDYCLSCAAYTAVDRAEDEPQRARAVNADAAATLARQCRQAGIPLIHLSTDYVYHLDTNRPLREDSPTDPKGVYARTKLDGDRAVLDIHPQAIVLRTSWVYSAFGNNFVKTMIRLGRERDELGVVYDQIGTPTYARDLARAMLEIVGQWATEGPPPDQLGQVYHYSNEGVTSWYDFALAIFEAEQIACRVRPLESYEFPTKAQRPFYSLLNKRKIKDTFGLRIPHWRTSLHHCLERLAEASSA